jgi:hypothetical protein
MLHSLIAYDANGDIVGTLDHMLAKDDAGNVAGLVDFAAHEDAGGRLREIWTQSSAVGSASWPEWIGSQAHDFTVELDPDPSPARARIKALVHKKSGHRRERAAIEAEIEKRINAARSEAHKQGDERRKQLKARGVKAEIVAQFSDPPPAAVDLRDLLGGPGKPLLLDENGKTRPRQQRSRPDLPVVKRG